MFKTLEEMEAAAIAGLKPVSLNHSGFNLIVYWHVIWGYIYEAQGRYISRAEAEAWVARMTKGVV